MVYLSYLLDLRGVQFLAWGAHYKSEAFCWQRPRPCSFWRIVEQLSSPPCCFWRMLATAQRRKTTVHSLSCPDSNTEDSSKTGGGWRDLFSPEHWVNNNSPVWTTTCCLKQSESALMWQCRCMQWIRKRTLCITEYWQIKSAFNQFGYFTTKTSWQNVHVLLSHFLRQRQMVAGNIQLCLC